MMTKGFLILLSVVSYFASSHGYFESFHLKGGFETAVVFKDHFPFLKTIYPSTPLQHARPEMLCLTKGSDKALKKLTKDEAVKVRNICGIKPKASNESLDIAFGTLAKMSDSPWTAGLLFFDGSFTCTGVVFSPWHVAISVHCFFNKDTSKIYPRALDFKVVYGGVCIVKSDICPDDVPAAYIHSIEKLFWPKSFSGTTATSRYDFAIIEVSTPFKFDHELRPICILPGNDNDVRGEKKRFVEVVCETNDLQLAGFSGDDFANPEHNSGRLRYMSMNWTASYDIPAGDEIVVESIKPGGQADRPAAVNGDSGGPLQCRAKGLERYVLVGNLKRAHNHETTLIPSQSVITLTPYYQRVFCPQTNACLSPRSYANF